MLKSFHLKGTTYEGATSGSTILQNVNLTIYNPTYCQYVSSSKTKNWNSQICAGEYAGGKDTCQGDSGILIFILNYNYKWISKLKTFKGGFLMVAKNISGIEKYFVAGVVSYGTGCARKYYPG